MLVIYPQSSKDHSDLLAASAPAQAAASAESTGGAIAQSGGQLAEGVRGQLVFRAVWLAAALIGAAFAGGAAWLATGKLPAASLMIGWPIGLVAACSCVMSLRRMTIRAFAVAVWGVAFPVLAAGYFMTCERAGLFVGVMPQWSWDVVSQAAVFFVIPSVIHAVVMAWACGEMGSWRAIVHLAIGLVAAGATMSAVLSGLGGEHGAPAVQVAVWNGVALLGVGLVIRLPVSED